LSYNVAKIKEELRKTNKKIGLVDATHYAVAKSKGLIFLTCDNDYSKLPNVEILT
jgi:predicted nucleic acid-binding protein